MIFHKKYLISWWNPIKEKRILKFNIIYRANEKIKDDDSIDEDEKD
jgi:hypothetical protein